ncbi:MAG: type VI secretion system contractile sheath large subunit [Planctomycetia bacterium]|nr:type VI secretion system contractile sheath large subunit [Planctomycetia bacterium]
MRYEMSFGDLGAAKSLPPAATTKFRIAILGDFSGAGNSGRLDTGDDLAAHKPQSVDVDNFDTILKRMKIKLHLPLAADGGAVEVPLAEIDDFHPDQLYDNVEVFSELSGLRDRLKNKGSFAAAAKELQAWRGELGDDAGAYAKPKDRSSTMPHGKLSDFARLVGSSAEEREETPADELIKQIVGPFVTAAKDPKQDEMVAAVDAALSEAMCRVLHHPDFQTLESLWRSVELLVRKLDSGSNLQIVLFDVSAEEAAADLSAAESLNETGLYKLLVEQPALDAQQGAFALIVGGYTFEQTPPHAELLGRIAKIATAARAPFLAAISNDCIKKLKPDEIHPLIKESWEALRGLPEANYLGLTAPRFMLRWPYGKKTEPIDSFAFEEFTRREGVSGMLWGNGAFLAALLLGETFQKQGLKAMKLGSVLTVGEMPYYYYTDSDGDQVALPCTDRLLSEALCQHVTGQGFMPLVSIKGRPEVRLASFQSLAGKTIFGPWSSEQITPSSMSTSGGAKPAVAGSAKQAEPEPAPVEESAAPAVSAAEAASADAELDALLASLGSSDPAPAAAGGDEIDPELAALLADL